MKISQPIRRITGAFALLALALASPFAASQPEPQYAITCAPQLQQSMERRALQGQAQAQLEMSQYYFSGKCTPKNLPLAVQWLRRGIETQARKKEKVDAMSVFVLGMLYQSGRGVAQNNVIAYSLMTLTAKSLDGVKVSPKPSTIQAEFEKKLSPSELAEGQSLIKQFNQENSFLGPIDRYLAASTGSH